jgi:hypothetical protein
MWNAHLPHKPPGFPGDYAARDLPFPSTIRSADSLEKFLRLPDAPQDNLPIGLVILHQFAKLINEVSVICGTYATVPIDPGSKIWVCKLRPD